MSDERGNKVQYLAGDFELREVDLFRGMMGAHCASLNGWDETEICEEGKGTGEHSTEEEGGYYMVRSCMGWRIEMGVVGWDGREF